MNILIGVTAGISAYKIADLVRLFIKQGHNVKVILTKNAEYFITKTTLETLSKNKVYIDEFDLSTGIAHIELAKYADVFLIAPASANTIAKLSSGICDNLLTATILAYKGKKLIFPSMNVDMLNNAITQSNIKKLIDYGFIVYPPECGELACGINASGRLPSIDIIYDLTLLNISNTSNNILKNKKVLISFGATKEHIDGVRFITNASSGLMGYNLIKEAYYRGADITILTNPEILNKYKDISYYSKNIILINSTDEALNAIKESFKECDIYISNMAFCDFTYKNKKKDKIKKQEKYNLELEQAEDVFSSLAKSKKNQLMVGFSLEADALSSLDYAKNKLKYKNMDLIVLNLVETINAKSSSFKILDKNLNISEYKDIAKDAFAKALFNKISEHYL